MIKKRWCIMTEQLLWKQGFFNAKVGAAVALARRFALAKFWMQDFSL
jgi:hypothetical protein